jgi:hypothetical protein
VGQAADACGFYSFPFENRKKRASRRLPQSPFGAEQYALYGFLRGNSGLTKAIGKAAVIICCCGVQKLHTGISFASL